MPKPPVPNVLAVPALSHEQRVWRLYKKSLLNAMDFSIRDKEWVKDRMILRERFEANQAVKDPELSRKLLEMGEDELRLHLHPYPYIHHKAPYGIEWQRNLAHPPNTLWMTPDEEIWFKDYLFYTQNPRRPTFFRRVLRFCGLSGY